MGPPADFVPDEIIIWDHMSLYDPMSTALLNLERGQAHIVSIHPTIYTTVQVAPNLQRAGRRQMAAVKS